MLSAVMLPLMNSVSPFDTKRAANLDILSLQKPIFSSSVTGPLPLFSEIAPPWVLFRKPLSSRYCRSLRTVILEIPNVDAISSALTSSLVLTRLRIFICLSSTAFLLFFIYVHPHQ